MLVLRPGLQVADLGCGAGHLGRLLHPAVAPTGRIDGFDADPAQVLAARQAGAPGCRFEEADARDVPRRAATYDRVVCQALLVHQPRPMEVLAEMVRLARPGGLVAAVEPVLPLVSHHPSSEPELDVLARRLFSAAGRSAVSAGLGAWSIARELPQLFAECGLDHIRTWTHGGVLAAPPGSAGTIEQRLLRALTDPAEDDAEGELLASLAAADGACSDQIRRARAYRRGVREARRSGLRAGTWWEWRQHPLLVCVGRIGAV